MQDIDIEFIIPDALIPVLEERGIPGELICDVQVWTEVIDEFAILCKSAFYTVIIKGIRFGGAEFEESYGEPVQGELLAEEELEDFPAEGVQVMFELYGRSTG